MIIKVDNVDKYTQGIIEILEQTAKLQGYFGLWPSSPVSNSALVGKPIEILPGVRGTGAMEDAK